VQALTARKAVEAAKTKMQPEIAKRYKWTAKPELKEPPEPTFEQIAIAAAIEYEATKHFRYYALPPET